MSEDVVVDFYAVPPVISVYLDMCKVSQEIEGRFRLI
jgi:hypothetical protein